MYCQANQILGNTIASSPTVKYNTPANVTQLSLRPTLRRDDVTDKHNNTNRKARNQQTTSNIKRLKHLAAGGSQHKVTYIQRKVHAKTASNRQ